MTVNPYSDPDADADILNDTPVGNSTNGNTQESHNFEIKAIVGGEALPTDLEEALVSFLNLNISGRRARTHVPLEFRAMTEMLEYFSGIYHLKEENAVSLAIADLLNELTDGRLSRYHKYHESRRALLSAHIMKRYANKMLTVIPPDETKNHLDECYSIISSFADLIEFTLVKATREYQSLCAELGKDVDESLIDGGLISQRSWWDVYAMGNPPGLEDAFDRI